MNFKFKKILGIVLILLLSLFVFNSCRNEKKITVEFKFYHSSAENVYLAGSFNNWSKTADKMTKNGNWFSISVPIKKDVQYKFVADGIWYSDPFNLKMVGRDFNSYLEYPVANKTNANPDIKVFESEHFEYYTKGEDKTPQLENIYNSLTKNILGFRKSQLEMDKIRYYGVKYQNRDFNNCFSVPSASYYSQIFDGWDCASSHEIIHTLVSIKNNALNEGMAQCFQKEGNETMKEQNINLFAKDYIKKNGSSYLENLLTKNIGGNGDAYKIVASFIYFNVIVMKNTEKFDTFLTSLEYSDKLDDIKSKYKNRTANDLGITINLWEKWLDEINKNSDIYVKGYGDYKG